MSKKKLADALLHPELAGLTAEERDFAEKLMRRGWSALEAATTARNDLADAAEEDGYDGP